MSASYRTDMFAFAVNSFVCLCYLSVCVYFKPMWVWAKQELFLHQDVPDKVSSVSLSCCGGGGRKVLKPLISEAHWPVTSRQLIYLIEEEMKAVGCT